VDAPLVPLNVGSRILAHYYTFEKCTAFNGHYFMKMKNNNIAKNTVMLTTTDELL
jgi:hypothetical protein